MLLPTDDTDRTLAPSELLPILARLIEDERLPIRSQFLYKLLQNIAKSFRLRDAVLRLLISLLVEDKDAANQVVKELTNGEQTEYESRDEGFTEEGGRAALGPWSPFAVRTGGGARVSTKGRGKVLSQLSASRLVAVLFHLASANVSAVFDMLRPRLNRGGVVKEVLTFNPSVIYEDETHEVTDTNTEDLSGEKMEQALIDHDKQQDARTLGLTNQVAGIFAANNFPSHKADNSTESLLEMLMPLFAHENFTSNASDLSELTAFINVVSMPLEYFSDSLEEDLKAKSGKYIRELSKGAVVVPFVGMTKNSLGYLCDVLLSDICTKSVFDNINAAISRLAIVPANRSVLTNLIAEVVGDLGAQSQSRLEVLLVSLQAVKSRQNGKESGKSAGLGVGSASLGAAASSSSSGLTAAFRASANELPLGEAGGRQHERFLRAVETLDSVAGKTKRSLLDLIPAEQLAPAWVSLDMVLTELHAYLAEDEEGKSEGTTRPQSTLISLLSRLLPVIEVFFMIHVPNIVSGDVATAAIVTTPAPNDVLFDTVTTEANGHLITTDGMRIHRFNDNTTDDIISYNLEENLVIESAPAGVGVSTPNASSSSDSVGDSRLSNEIEQDTEAQANADTVLIDSIVFGEPDNEPRESLLRISASHPLPPRINISIPAHPSTSMDSLPPPPLDSSIQAETNAFPPLPISEPVNDSNSSLISPEPIDEDNSIQTLIRASQPMPGAYLFTV
jgi:hypothetical protein